MPPRYAYWTILIGDEPTAFRSGSQDELMPTLKRLQQRHAEARMMWWQNGKLWNSRLDAQEAMRARGEIGRSSDPRQEERGRRPFKPAGERYSERAPRASERRAERAPSGKLDWKPKSSSPQAPKPSRSERPEWKPKGSFKPERAAKRGPEWKPKTSSPQDLKPSSPEKRKWIPKEEYKRSQAPSPKSQVPKDKNWRPGGEHKDPRQKYKDAKKAKWGRFKQTVRKRWESKQGGKKKNE